MSGNCNLYTHKDVEYKGQFASFFFLENFSLDVFILSEDREEMKQKSY